MTSDALLGLLAHGTLAIGLVFLAFMTWVRVDLMGFFWRYSCDYSRGHFRHMVWWNNSSGLYRLFGNHCLLPLSAMKLQLLRA